MKTILGIMIVVIIGLSVFSEPKIVTELQSGEKSLECLFTDGWKDVPKEKIVGFDDVNGRWLFTNGSATNCEIY